jgi:hypothetical protein
MNRYSLSSDSRRWWWPSATAGALGTAAVTALILLPAAGGQAMPVPTTHHEAPGTVFWVPDASTERPCFIRQPHWNDALDGPQPVCPLDTDPHVAVNPGVVRPWLDYLP